MDFWDILGEIRMYLSQTYARGIFRFRRFSSSDEEATRKRFEHSRAMEAGSRNLIVGDDIFEQDESDKLDNAYRNTVMGHLLRENTVFEFVFMFWLTIFMFATFKYPHKNNIFVTADSIEKYVLAGIISFLGAMCAAIILESDRDTASRVVLTDVYVLAPRQRGWHSPIMFLLPSIGPVTAIFVTKALGFTTVSGWLKLFTISWFIGAFLDLVANTFTVYGVMWLFPLIKKRFHFPRVICVKDLAEEWIFKVTVFIINLVIEIVLARMMFRF